jgi:hypothetical protein
MIAFALFFVFCTALLNPSLASGQSIPAVPVYPWQDLQSLGNQCPSSTTFVITPGTYRLQTIVPKVHDVFSGEPGAIISGAALLINFTQSGSNWVSQAQVTQASSYPGQRDSAHPACTSPEDLFFDSVAKTRVTNPASVGPGTWYLDYSRSTLKHVVVSTQGVLLVGLTLMDARLVRFAPNLRQ